MISPTDPTKSSMAVVYSGCNISDGFGSTAVLSGAAVEGTLGLSALDTIIANVLDEVLAGRHKHGFSIFTKMNVNSVADDRGDGIGKNRCSVIGRILVY